MNSNELVKHIENKRSFLCVGLDTDPVLIPAAFQKEADPVFAFNKAVILIRLRWRHTWGMIRWSPSCDLRISG